MKKVQGKVYLVGAGPGAADLITLRGARLLAKADIVFHDALVEQAMLDLCPQAIHVPVGKRCGKLSTAQRFIEKRMIDAASHYEVIVRLKGGDPMMFGRADEELRALEQQGIDVEVVPGITAGLAAAATLKQSLTLRGVSRSVAFVTLARAEGESHEVDLTELPNADTLVYYMGRNDTIRIASQLIALGKSPETPIAIIESISTANERLLHLTLQEMKSGRADEWFTSSAPALFIVGDAMALRATNPLKQSTVVASEFDDRLEDIQILANRLRRA